METRLVRIDNIKQELAAARDLYDILEIRDRAKAAGVYAEAKGLGEAAQLAKEAQLRAERVAGEFLSEMVKAKGSDCVGRDYDGTFNRRSQPETDGPATLSDLGISKSQSHRWQTIASLPEEEFEEHIAKCKDDGHELTQASVLRLAKDLTSDRADYDGDEWHTPQEYIDAAREVMGDIDLDPATCETAQTTIQASEYFTKADDGLVQAWRGRVWLNPPYSFPLIELFINKAIVEYERGEVTEAIVLVNNSSDTEWFHFLLERYPACFTRGRVKFWHPNYQGFATRQGQTFFYLGGDIQQFIDVFSKFGIVVEKLDNQQS